MDPSWIQILVVLLFYQKGASGDDVTVKDGALVEISCQPREVGTMVVWFRVLDDRGMEFIASFSNSGMQKSTFTPSSSFSFAKIRQHVVTLNSFNRGRDVGAYSCASLFRGTELKFGKVTRLVAEAERTRQEEREVPVTTAAPAAGEGNRCATSSTCVCGSEESSPMFCAPFILGALAGGCGLLLLLLITVILHCNKIRTRRCPHHYKRKPRVMAGGRQ